MSTTLEQALTYVVKNCPLLSGHQERTPPLVYAGHARSGKTTFLFELFDKLKNEGFAPIFLSFQSPNKLSTESYTSYLLRQIALQMCVPMGTAAQTATINEAALKDHIAKTALGTKGVVLMIDELNQLVYDDALDNALAQELKDSWLDLENRYLVFTSHIPLDLDPADTSALNLRSTGMLQPRSDRTTASSSRRIVTVKHPLCMDTPILTKMFESSAVSITPAQAAVYGGVPSLVYTAMRPGSESLETLFEKSYAKKSMDPEEEKLMLREFLGCLVTGLQSTRVKAFYSYGIVPAPGLIHWPIVYIALLLNLFTEGQALGLNTLVHKKLEAYTSRLETGLDWELIVQTAILIQALRAKTLFDVDVAECTTATGPFGIVNAFERVTRVEVVLLPGCVVDTESALRHMNAHMYKYQAGTILVATPQFAKFPVLDGFVMFKQSNREIRTFGYQVKLGRAYPKGKVPTGLEKGFLVRGKAPGSSGSSEEWVYMSDSDIDVLLGASLKSLKPSEWPEQSVEDDLA